jgi:hypothetical protein
MVQGVFRHGIRAEDIHRIHLSWSVHPMMVSDTWICSLTGFSEDDNTHSVAIVAAKGNTTMLWSQKLPI